MQIGGVRRLVIPALAGWGGNVPRNAVLVADVRLMPSAADSARLFVRCGHLDGGSLTLMGSILARRGSTHDA